MKSPIVDWLAVVALAFSLYQLLAIDTDRYVRWHEERYWNGSAEWFENAFLHKFITDPAFWPKEEK